MRDLYNVQVSWSDTRIWLATADVKSCFRTPKLYPGGCGSFGYVFPFMKMFFISTAMVFGYDASARSWEPLQHAIEKNDSSLL